jgi:hypothetical protein
VAAVSQRPLLSNISISVAGLKGNQFADEKQYMYRVGTRDMVPHHEKVPQRDSFKVKK